MEPQKEKSSHILNASSNLPGICFIVLTSLKVLDKSEKTIIDELTVVAIILFMASCIFSFLSIRRAGNHSAASKRSAMLEGIADIIFLAGLSLLFATTILFSFNIIH